MSIDTNENTGNEQPQVEAVSQEAVETSSEGTQPSGEANPNPAPEIQQGRDPIPKTRFNEVIVERNHLRAENSHLVSLLQQRQQPEQPKPAPQAPRQDDFSTYEEYIRADARFTAEKSVEDRWNALQQKQQQAAQAQSEHARTQTVETNWSQKSSDASVKYADFDTKISTCPPLAPHALQVLKASPAAGDLAYHLASNPDLIGRLNGMHPFDAVMELGRMEGKLAGSTTPPKPSVSKAPKPISPVGSGKTTSPSAYRDDMSEAEYLAMRHPIRS
ncbi:MAG: hypothetical protein M3Y08_18195 [Fibrobacterota bacterium]|nr:hypothetical protein [Fibrobacterota bacterium]